MMKDHLAENEAETGHGSFSIRFLFGFTKNCRSFENDILRGEKNYFDLNSIKHFLFYLLLSEQSWTRQSQIISNKANGYLQKK